jgi:hypothetical protein
MAWSSSNIFVQWVNNPMCGPKASLPTSYAGLVADTVKVTLYDNTTAPDRTAAVTSTGYNTSTWTTGNEVNSGTDWVAGGIALASAAVSVSAGVLTYAAANISSSATATITAYGILVYDSTITGGTVAKQGICFNYFGGVQTVTAGTFSVNFSASGIFTFTV